MNEVNSDLDDSHDLLDRAEDLLDEGDLDEALEAVRTLQGREEPSSVRGRALAIEAVCLEELGRGDEAEKLIGETMKEEGDDAVYVLAAGVEFSDLDAHDHAEMFLKNLCGLDPSNHLPWFNLAISFGRDERFKEAIEAYDECIKRAPDFGEAYAQKAHCTRLMNDLDGAAALYRTYLGIEPADGDAWAALANVESEREEFDAAYAAFDRAIACGANAQESYFNWAITAAQREDAVKLNACLTQLQQLDPEGWRTHLIRAEWEESQGNQWPAWEALAAARDAARDSVESTDDLEDEAPEYAALASLEFAERHKMADHLEEVTDYIFSLELFSDDILDAMRIATGRLSRELRSYQVVLEFGGGEDEDGEDEGPVYLVYGVAAEGEEEAVLLATKFQSSCEDPDFEIYSVSAISAPDEGHVGVYWRSLELDIPPGGRNQDLN